jgi:translation initiation factor IF-3
MSNPTKQGRKPFRVIKQREHLINDEIKNPQVRVSGEGLESQIVPIEEAKNLALQMEGDLILIAPNVTPPVCVISEYQKFVYQLKKKEDEKKKKSKNSQMREIHIGPHISDNDLNVKVKKAIEFLTDGDKVKLQLELRGRENVYQKEAQIKMLKFADMVQEVGKPDSLPKFDGKEGSKTKFVMLFSPKAKK